jgi:hypothetical protein
MACAGPGCQSDVLTSAFDAVDGSSTGIAMRHIAVSREQQRESASGTKREFSPERLEGRKPPHCRRSGVYVGKLPVCRPISKRPRTRTCDPFAKFTGPDTLPFSAGDGPNSHVLASPDGEDHALRNQHVSTTGALDHDGKCGANVLRATIVGDWREPSGESRSKLHGQTSTQP